MMLNKRFLAGAVLALSLGLSGLTSLTAYAAET